MKQPLRAFAIGLFSAGLIMLIVHYFADGSTKDFTEVPVEEVIQYLKEDGYRVLTESEYIALSVNQDKEPVEEEQADNVAEKQDSEEKQTNPSEQEVVEGDGAENQVISYTITIVSGMVSSTIAQELEANNIIENADEFNRYLDSEGYSVRIQLGEFTVTNEMSHYEIAELITS